MKEQLTPEQIKAVLLEMLKQRKEARDKHSYDRESKRYNQEHGAMYAVEEIAARLGIVLKLEV